MMINPFCLRLHPLTGSMLEGYQQKAGKANPFDPLAKQTLYSARFRCFVSTPTKVDLDLLSNFDLLDL